MMTLFFVVLAWLLGYVWGIRVGVPAGKKAGRAVADAEWARWAENGAL